MEIKCSAELHQTHLRFYHALYLFPDIWIIGDSLITHLHERAIFRHSVNLGLDGRKVHWIGSGGMLWEQLLPKLQLEMLFRPMPSFIVIQVGGNNIVDVKLSKLIKTVRHDMTYICTGFEKVKIVWSDILPRKRWRGALETEDVLKHLDIKRKRVNRLGRQVVRESPNGRAIVSDSDLFTSGLFKPDGVHLTDIGNDILLNTFQEALLAFVQNPNKKLYEA